MTLNFWKKTGTFLVALNILLLVAAWVMTFYSYPRVPAAMAARLGIFGWEFGPRTKSLLFFACPFVQTLLNILAVIAGRLAAFRSRNPRVGALREEHLDMAMIFVNVVLIHLERNFIALAYLGKTSLNKTYLITLGVIIFLIYLYYRLRISAPSGRA